MKAKEKLGQVFTPDIIAKYMVDLISLKKGSKILDPCFGEGVFFKYLQQKEYKIEGNELDRDLYLKKKEELKNIKLYNKNFLNFEKNGYYDGIIMNPPYIRHEKINNMEKYNVTKEKLHTKKIYKGLNKKANLYMYFLLKAIDLLKVNGELIVIFPNTWKKTKVGKSFFKLLTKNSTVASETNLTGNVFGTKVLVDVFILKIIKSKINIKRKKRNFKFEENQLIKINRIRDNLKNKEHISLKKISKSRRGITTGWNNFFINDDINELEFDKYRKRILSSPKNIIGYSSKKANLDYILDLNERNLKDISNKKISDYIRKSEQKLLDDKKPKTLYRKLKEGKQWYKLRKFNCKGIIFSYIIRNQIKFALNNSKDILIRDNFYIIHPKINIYLLLGLLNNYFTFYRIEKKGKQYGGGVLKLQKYDMTSLKVVSPEIIKEKDKKKIIKITKMLISTTKKEYIFNITKILENYEYKNSEYIYDKYIQLKNRRLKN